METMYLTLDEARVVLRNGLRKQASGGQGQAYCTVLPRCHRKAGKVLDFEACRKALEEPQTVPEEGTQESPVPTRRWSLGLALELALSAAIFAMVAVTAAGFFLA